MVTVTVLMNYGLEYVNDLNMDRWSNDLCLEILFRWNSKLYADSVRNIQSIKSRGFFHADRWLVTGNKLIMICITL